MKRIHGPGFGLTPYKIVLLLLVGAAVIGLVLGMVLHGTCLLRHSVPVATKLALAGPPAVLIVVWLARQPRGIYGLETAWFRWVAMPFAVLAMTGLLIIIVLGWVIGVSRLLASQPTTIELPLLAVEHPTGRRVTCRQVLLVRYQEELGRLCAEGLLAEPGRFVGRPVTVQGLSSSLGLHVQSIHAP